MKSKKSIYILLPLVLIIWGAIIYQFFTYSTTEANVVSVQDYSVKPLKIKQKDTFSIKIKSRDPFSGKMVDNATKKVSSKRKATNKTLEIKQELIWPQISYKGIVSDTKDKIKIFMIIIGGKTFLMKQGEIENDILLTGGDGEKINLKYRGESKVVFIQ